MHDQKGFSLVEVFIAAAMLAVIVSLAVFTYYKQYVGGQTSESLQFMKAQTINTANLIKTSGRCTNVEGVPDVLKAKFGDLTISGQYNASAGQSCKSGCTYTFTFNETDVAPAIAKQVVQADVLNNMKLSKDEEKTTVLNRFLSSHFINIPTVNGDNCSLIPDTTPAPKG